MSFRFITKSIHAYLIDYPVAIVLIAAPFVLKLGQSGPVAMWLSVIVGVAAVRLRSPLAPGSFCERGQSRGLQLPYSSLEFEFGLQRENDQAQPA